MLAHWQTLSRLPMHNIYNVILQLMSDRGFIVPYTSCTTEYFESNFCFTFADQPGILHVDREKLALSLVHMQDREKNVRIFFLEPTGQKIGKKELEALLKRLGDTRTRGMFIIPDGSELTSHAKKMIDETNRSDKKVMIEYFMEKQVEVNICAWGKQYREYRVLSTIERDALLKKVQKTKLAIISYTDPLARYFGLQHDDVLALRRGSETAGMTSKYMRCVYAEQTK